jgi:DNA-binding transcriptional MerR regulator
VDVTGDRYNRESLAAMVGIPERTLRSWIEDGLISPAHQPPHSKSPNQKFYSDLHVRELRALIAVKEHNTHFRDLGRFFRETKTTAVHYARMRGITGHA